MRLKSLLEPYAPALVVTADTPEVYYLNTHYAERYQKEVFFGAVQIKKNYVSYYLMPVGAAHMTCPVFGKIFPLTPACAILLPTA
jgi:hypothetical protein